MFFWFSVKNLFTFSGLLIYLFIFTIRLLERAFRERFCCRHVLNARIERCGQHPGRGGCAKNGGLVWLRPLGKFTQCGQWCKPETFSVFIFPFQPAKAFLFQSLLFYFNQQAEMGFHSGDIIYVLGDMDQDGFYYVSVTAMFLQWF